MKSKLGKILIPTLILMLLFGTATVLYFAQPAEATPIGDVRERLGAFTGPSSGTEQDDNVKASLDLIHNIIGAPSAAKGTGSVFYVDSGASGGETGLNWTDAVLTLDAGINLCTTNRGDYVLVAAGHTENWTTQAADIDLASVTVIGLGVGENAPVFSYTGASGELAIAADDVAIYNLNFLANVTDVTNAINVETGAENWIIDGCRFYVETTGTDEFTDAITTTANCDNGKVRNCRVEMGAGGADAFVQNVGCDYVEITGNIVSGDFATACIQDVTTASIWLFIDDNTFVNGTVAGTAGLNAVACISLKSDTSAIITDNRLFCNVATPNLAIVAADGFISGNTYGQAEGTFAGSVPVGVGANSGSMGLRCAEVTPASIAAVTNLFQVTGGPIIIRDIIGVVTTNIVATGCLINYNIDPIAPANDTVFGTDGTALEINGDAAGTVYTWDGVIATDLTATTTGVLLTQGTDVSNGILCPIGMIELAATATNAGVIKFYIVYSPLSPLSVVTPQ